MSKTLNGSDLVLIHGFRNDSSLAKHNKQMHHTLTRRKELGYSFSYQSKSANNRLS